MEIDHKMGRRVKAGTNYIVTFHISNASTPFQSEFTLNYHLKVLAQKEEQNLRISA